MWKRSFDLKSPTVHSIFLSSKTNGYGVTWFNYPVNISTEPEQSCDCHVNTEQASDVHASIYPEVSKVCAHIFLSAKHLYVSKFPHARTHERPLYSNFKTVRSEQLNAMITQNLLLAQFFL